MSFKWIQGDKLHRKCCKKLKEIELLKEMAANGSSLQPNQEQKVAQEASWLSQKHEIEMRHNEKLTFNAIIDDSDTNDADDITSKTSASLNDIIRDLRSTVFEIGKDDDESDIKDPALFDTRRQLWDCLNDRLTHMDGVVKFFDPVRHFGFICGSKSSPDIFFHEGDVHGSMVHQGDLVKFMYVVPTGDNESFRPWATMLVSQSSFKVYTGKIVKHVPGKFGFIEYIHMPSDDFKEVRSLYFHSSEVRAQGKLVEGTQVKFKIGKWGGKSQAQSVEVATA